MTGPRTLPRCTIHTRGMTDTISTADLVPWLLGLTGGVAGEPLTLPLHGDTQVVTIPGQETEVYDVELGGEMASIPGTMVIPWVRGMAVRNRVDPGGIDDPTKPAQNRRQDLLMRAHASGWLTYRGMRLP